MDRNSSKAGVQAGGINIAFGLVILLALVILALLRHFFGSIRVEAGTK
jgi:hypothetical protein